MKIKKIVFNLTIVNQSNLHTYMSDHCMFLVVEIGQRTGNSNGTMRNNSYLFEQELLKLEL